MAIVKMKRLRLIAMKSDRDAIFKKLLRLGCLEVSEQSEKLADPEWAPLIKAAEGEVYDLKQRLSEIKATIAVLDNFVPVKTSLFAPRPELKESELFSIKTAEKAVESAKRIEEINSEFDSLSTQRNKLEATRISLEPWEPLDIPLESTGTSNMNLIFGTLPRAVEMDELDEELAERAEDSQLFVVSSGRDQHCFLLACHRSKHDECVSVLKCYGYSPVSFKGIQGTAAVNIASIDRELSQIEEKRTQNLEELKKIGKDRLELKIYSDRLEQDITEREAKARLVSTDSTFFLDGWAPVPELTRLTKLLDSFDCAYELSDPTPEDNTPVLLKNNKLTEPLMMVTEMYSLPSYDGIDPNPLITPFFTIFFGIMYADIGYGLILIAIALFAKLKLKLRATMKYMMGMLLMCGVTAVIFGVLSGSFFGNAITILGEMFGKDGIELWSKIDPLNDPIPVLIGAYAIGAIQVIFGMAVDAYMKIKKGRWLDAFFDDGIWWIVFAGIAVGALGGTWLIAVAGGIGIILTAGRDSPTIGGKIGNGIYGLYNITAYLGDILSYTRLMTLMLAGGVVANVINILGSMAGIIVFIPIFIFGHAFNMGLNIIGTYVHSSRLQYLEFFGKFYKEGGKPFTPLKIKTNYVDLIKEEN